MAHKKETRPRGDAGRASDRFICLAAMTYSENTLSKFNVQELFLSRRFGLSPERAAIIASLAFGEARS